MGHDEGDDGEKYRERDTKERNKGKKKKIVLIRRCSLLLKKELLVSRLRSENDSFDVWISFQDKEKNAEEKQQEKDAVVIAGG